MASSLTPERAISRLSRLLAQIPDIRNAVHDDASPLLTNWKQDVQIALVQIFGSPSLQVEQFNRIHFESSIYYSGMSRADIVNPRMEGLATAEGFLKSRIIELEEEQAEPKSDSFTHAAPSTTDGKKVFVVHGHDHGTKETVARYLSQLGLNPIILHEQPNAGSTIIEKFEKHSDVSCAVIILTGDDLVTDSSNPGKSVRRARQNVIFEMGFFSGRLGRAKTIALVAPEVEVPSDLAGLLYIPLTEANWKLTLLGELKAAGLVIDANRAFG